MQFHTSQSCCHPTLFICSIGIECKIECPTSLLRTKHLRSVPSESLNAADSLHHIHPYIPSFYRHLPSQSLSCPIPPRYLSHQQLAAEELSQCSSSTASQQISRIETRDATASTSTTNYPLTRGDAHCTQLQMQTASMRNKVLFQMDGAPPALAPALVPAVTMHDSIFHTTHHYAYGACSTRGTLPAT